jgi:hypothetical protein
MNKMKEKEKIVSKLRHFFAEVDTSGDGMIDKEEFEEVLEDMRMQAWLHVLELEVYEVTALFNLLDDGDGAISCEEFIGGAMRLKGNARAIDAITLMHEQHLIKHEIHKVGTGMHDLWQHLHLDSKLNPWPAPAKAAQDHHHSLLITVIGAKSLRKADAFGDSDPYCEFHITGRKDMKWRTPVIHNTQDPTWDFEQDIADFNQHESIVFNIYDMDIGDTADFLGSCSVPHEDIVPNGFAGELQLRGKQAKGVINLKIEIVEVRQSKKAVWKKIQGNANSAVHHSSTSSLEEHP